MSNFQISILKLRSSIDFTEIVPIENNKFNFTEIIREGKLNSGYNAHTKKTKVFMHSRAIAAQ